jgi:putative RecB family exonuclease
MHRQRPHWSYSSITQYLTCPLRYYFQRILGLPQPTVGSSLVLGSAVHAALAEYHRDLKDGRVPRPDRMRQAYVNEWNRRDGTEVTYKDGENQRDLMDQGMALVDLYLKEPPPERIVAIEQDMIAPVRNSRGEYLETPLVAVADLIIATDEGLVIRELKTAARAYSESETNASLQPTCYVNAVEEVYGEPTTVAYTVLVKTKTPKIQHLETTRSHEDLGRLGDIIEAVERAVQAEIFYPVENPIHCSTCPYREPCREWGRPKIPAESLLPVIALGE